MPCLGMGASKAYKGKTCAYCAEANASTTADHVFAREFFPIERRGNLPKVPSCQACNSGKATLEHYFTAVLPFAGRHADARELLKQMVPPRLAKNRALHAELVAGGYNAWLRSDGLLRPTMTLPLDAVKLEQWVRLIVRGLIAHHWSVVLPAHYHIGVAVWTEAGEREIGRVMPQQGAAVTQASWGGGAFEYRGVQATDDPFLSIWRLTLYGGALLGGDPEASIDASPRIWAMTSRRVEPVLFRYPAEQ